MKKRLKALLLASTRRAKSQEAFTGLTGSAEMPCLTFMCSGAKQAKMQLRKWLPNNHDCSC